MRLPDMPRGWPMAMAPPLTLTMSIETPRSSAEATPTAAKASLISNRSMSPTERSVRLRAALIAREGWWRSEASGPATWP